MKTIISLIMTVIFVSPVLAKAPLWKVSKGNDHLYIGGTVHVLGENDYPLPPAFDAAYSQAEQLVFETDIDKLKSPTLQAKLLTMMSYQDGSTLEDHLKPKTYSKLKAFLANNGIPIIAIKRFKPGIVSSMLSMIELKKLGISSIGVDQFYNNKAVNDHKTLGKLETVEQQLDFIASLGKDDPDEFILYTLQDIKQLPEMFKDIKQAWRKGDIQKLEAIAIEPMKADYPTAYQNIIVKRNKAWIPQIEAMLKTKEVEMILVGALHLAGDESVLTLLKRLGYKVEQL